MTGVHSLDTGTTCPVSMPGVDAVDPSVDAALNAVTIQEAIPESMPLLILVGVDAGTKCWYSLDGTQMVLNPGVIADSPIPIRSIAKRRSYPYHITESPSTQSRDRRK